jgi:hypothetical protein
MPKLFIFSIHFANTKVYVKTEGGSHRDVSDFGSISSLTLVVLGFVYSHHGRLISTEVSIECGKLFPHLTQ